MNLQNWKPYQPSEQVPWNLKRVVHLHRRAAFAAPWSTIQRDLEDGPDTSIDRLLNASNQPNESMANTIGDAAVASGNSQRLKAWWLYRMVTTTDPLVERLVLMWHNHFATSNRKVNDLDLMRQQNELFRSLGRGPFGKLLSAVVKHPALMVWLDADSNRKGKANENLARELMELFTVGSGNYTEADVKEAARALTGWTVINEEFAFKSSRHDKAKLTILEKSQPFNGDQLLELLLSHAGTAKQIARRLCKTFMGEGTVSETAITELANGLVENDLDIRWAMETMLRSELFFDEVNIGAKILGPTEFIVGSIRALEFDRSPPSTMILSQWLTRMGQDLFYPPNVGGWKEGRSWLGSRAIVARANFAKAMADGQLWHPEKVPYLKQLAKGYGVEGSAIDQVRWLCKLMIGRASKTLVEETVKSMPADNRTLTLAMAFLLAKPDYQLG